MATTDLIGAPERAEQGMSLNDVLAHEASSYVRIPTAPLPLVALEAMRSLELRLTLPADVVDAVIVYRKAATHSAGLAALVESGRMTDLDARSLADAEDLKAAARATLAEAGRLDLIGGAS